MTWPDVVFIVVMIIFLAVGARMGSLWTGACLLGGFLGAYLIDYYTAPFADILGGFSGSHLFAAGILFVAGLAIFLLPGLLLSKISSGMILGVIDGAFGLITGGLAGLFAMTLCILSVMPLFPKIEATSAWKSSKIVHPFQRSVENIFNSVHFRPAQLASTLRDEAEQRLEPVAKGTERNVERLFDKLKKKAK